MIKTMHDLQHDSMVSTRGDNYCVFALEKRRIVICLNDFDSLVSGIIWRGHVYFGQMRRQIYIIDLENGYATNIAIIFECDFVNTLSNFSDIQSVSLGFVMVWKVSVDHILRFIRVGKVSVIDVLYFFESVIFIQIKIESINKYSSCSAFGKRIWRTINEDYQLMDCFYLEKLLGFTAVGGKCKSFVRYLWCKV